MGIMKMIKGEPMPDKDDPKYRERYEREVEAGKRFAEKSGINWLTVKVYQWANTHRVAFLAMVFGIVITLLCLNVYSMLSLFRGQRTGKKKTAVELVDQALMEKHKNKR